jgi:hypothetical protein
LDQQLRYRVQEFQTHQPFHDLTPMPLPVVALRFSLRQLLICVACASLLAGSISIVGKLLDLRRPWFFTYSVDALRFSPDGASLAISRRVSSGRIVSRWRRDLEHQRR